VIAGAYNPNGIGFANVYSGRYLTNLQGPMILAQLTGQFTSDASGSPRAAPATSTATASRMSSSESYFGNFAQVFAGSATVVFSPPALYTFSPPTLRLRLCRVGRAGT